MANILIIDDDPDIRKFLADCLGERGHMIMVAECLAEGRELNAFGRFDLILLDVNLPDGTGLEAITDFKQSKSEPEVIIPLGLWYLKLLPTR